MREATQAMLAAYEQAAATYDDHMKGAIWALHDHVTFSTVGPLLPPPGAAVLDAGAGSGRCAMAFLARGDHVTLLDPSAAMLDQARRRVASHALPGRARFVLGTLEDMGVAGGRFDLVFSEGDPLSYCGPRRAEAAREVLRVLKPGGAFYASVDNRWIATLGLLAHGPPADAFAAADEGRGFDPYGVAVHAFGANELRDLFVDAGAVDVCVGGKVVLSHLLPPGHLDRLAATDVASWERLLALEARLARDPTLAGVAGHLHATGRKPTEGA